MLKYLSLVCAATLASGPLVADTLGLGRTATPSEVEAWDIDVRPDGIGLPVGAGNVEDGEELFVEKCASCHGDFGEGVDRWPVLAGGHDTLTDDRPVKTVGSYWPYLSTVWDYVHRAMPFGDAQSLSDDDTYAIVAYILYSNDMVEDDFVLSDQTFGSVTHSNEAAFYMDDRASIEYPSFRADACMTGCKASVEITKRARIIDVTPEETAAAEATTATVVAASEVASTEEAAPDDATDDVSKEPEVAVLDEALVKKGKKTFKKCKACHKIGDGAKNGVGPHLNGIFGQAVAANEGFAKKYSKVMKTAGADGLVWDDETLREFLRAPRKYLKGTKMSFAGLRKDADLDAVIEYLKSESQ